MRTWAFAIWAVCALIIGGASYGEAAQSQVNWTTNYQDALNQAKQNSKPILLFFTGSDWCTWCQKLEHEVFQSPDFASSVGDKFIFVKLDYPRSFRLDYQTEAQNQRLQEKYNIRAYPTVIVIDGNEGFLGNVNRNGSVQKYVSDLVQLANRNNASKK